MKLRFTCFIVSFISMIGVQQTFCQINGKVTSIDGDAISYASIYITQSSSGTITNESGEYSLNVKKGEVHLICEYLGYESQDTIITYTGNAITLDFQLTPKAYEIGVIEITNNKEDPAYRIIRSAMSARESHLHEATPYANNLYLKGSYALEKLPTKIFGIQIVESDSAAKVQVDSIKKIYLSETVSTIYKSEDDFFEHIHSSRVSGMSDLYSFNRGSAIDYSFYERNLNLPFGTAINPIGPVALQFYRFKLLGEFQDGEHTIYKIKVIPKNQHDPVLFGDLYIVDKLWSVYGIELSIEGENLNFDGVDSIHISQNYIPVKPSNSDQIIWLKFKSNLELYFKLFGIEVSGGFYGLYSDYEFDVVKPDSIGSREQVRFSDGANQKDSSYWNDVRPIALTEIEKIDYKEKDSLEIIFNSEEYLDSIDKVNNKFKFQDITMGYSHTNRHDSRFWDISSPLMNLNFNPVQGFNTDIEFNYRTPKIMVMTGLEYGFSDKVWRPKLRLAVPLNRKSELSLSYLSELVSLNEKQAPTKSNNSFMNLYFHKNPLKLIEEKKVNLEYKMKLSPAMEVSSSLHTGRRSIVSNTSNYSFFRKNDEYDSNHLMNDGNVIDQENLTIGNHNFLQYAINFTYQFGVSYIRYPERIQVNRIKGPKVEFLLSGGIPLSNQYTDFSSISLSLHYAYRTGIFGRSRLHFIGNYMIHKNKLSARNIIYPADNGSYILKKSAISKSFLGMEPYRFYSDEGSASFLYRHDFSGYIFNKIPYLRKTGFTLTSGLGAYADFESNNYYEFSLGIGNIGFNLIRLFRFDVTAPFHNNKFKGMHYSVGLLIDGSVIMRLN